jgi:hypothetical protein
MRAALARETTVLRRSTIDVDGIRSPVLEAGPERVPCSCTATRARARIGLA